MSRLYLPCLVPFIGFARGWQLPLWYGALVLFFPPTVSAQLGPDEGLPVVAWQDAEQVVGRLSRVFGEVVDVGHAPQVHFLNFKRHDRSSFSVVIFSDSLERFDATLEELYMGRKVVVRGTVTLYKGAPQIVVARPSQIEVVEQFPDSQLSSYLPATVGNPLVIGTYNVQNLFDEHDDPYTHDEATPAKPRSEMQQLAGVIRELNADLLALQEVENRGYLQRFVDTLLPEMGYRHIVHFEGNDLRGIDVALLSRLPVGKVTSHRHSSFPSADGRPEQFRRDLLRVEILPEGGSPFEVWLVHLKSNAGDSEQAQPIREAEARAIRQRIESQLHEDPAAEFILCGDLNDTIDSVTLQTILGSQAPYMRSLFDDVPEGERVTYNREPHRSMIDFLLCSPAMAARYVPDSYTIRQGSPSESGSDHNPVTARFHVGPGDPLAGTRDGETSKSWWGFWRPWRGDAGAPRRADREERTEGVERWRPVALGLAVAMLLIWFRCRTRRTSGE